MDEDFIMENLTSIGAIDFTIIVEYLSVLNNQFSYIEFIPMFDLILSLKG